MGTVLAMTGDSRGFSCLCEGKMGSLCEDIQYTNEKPCAVPKTLIIRQFLL